MNVLQGQLFPNPPPLDPLPPTPIVKACQAGLAQVALAATGKPPVVYFLIEPGVGTSLRGPGRVGQ